MWRLPRTCPGSVGAASCAALILTLPSCEILAPLTDLSESRDGGANSAAEGGAFATGAAGLAGSASGGSAGDDGSAPASGGGPGGAAGATGGGGAAERDADVVETTPPVVPSPPTLTRCKQFRHFLTPSNCDVQATVDDWGQRAVAFSPDGLHLASSSPLLGVHSWMVEGHKLALQRMNQPGGA